MNTVLYYLFFAGWIYLPLAVLVVRGFWPQRINLPHWFGGHGGHAPTELYGTFNRHNPPPL
jgi:hypothetical protein